MKQVCSIHGCDRQYYGRGYCSPHYQRWRRHGDPLAGGTPYGEPMRFIHEVALFHTGKDCLTWPFSKDGHGYGTVRVDGKMISANRYVCELVRGAPEDPEHQAAHSCGKGHEGCISPVHLSWKTRIGNKDDELLHGTRPRGEHNGHAKLTEIAVREIIALRGVELQSKLAERFGVSRPTIADVQTGRSWAHVEG